MPKHVFACFLLLAVTVSQASAGAAPCCVHDHRTIWLKDLYRSDEIRVAPFGRHGIPCRRDWIELPRFFCDRHGHRRIVAPALLRVLAEVQRHFGGRRIDLYSGYRAPDQGQALDSYHKVGHASDIAVEGIERRALFEYCRRLQVTANSGLGCGLYPHRAFVNVDARSRSVMWVDLGHRSYVSDPEAWLEAHPVAGRPSARERRRRRGSRNRSRIRIRIGSSNGNRGRSRSGSRSRSGIRSCRVASKAPRWQPRPAFLAAPPGSGFRACGATAVPEPTLGCARFCHGACAEGHTNPEPEGGAAMTFQAFDIALDLIRSVREPLARIATRDPDLDKQLRRAASSIALNLGEARRRFGRDRNHLFRVAAGSAGEVAAALRVAEAWGYLQDRETAEALALCDRLLAITWKLTH